MVGNAHTDGDSASHTASDVDSSQESTLKRNRIIQDAKFKMQTGSSVTTGCLHFAFWLLNLHVAVQCRIWVATSLCSLSVQLPRSAMIVLFGDRFSRLSGMTHGSTSTSGSSTVT